MANGNEGLLIRWNEETGTGTVTILTLSYPWAEGWGPLYQINLQKRYAEIISIFNGDTELSEIFSTPIVTSTVTRPINRENLNTILSGQFESGNVLQYAAGLPLTLPVQDGSQTGGSTSQGTSTGTTTGSSTGTSNGSNGNGMFSSGSVGTTGTAVNAATQTTTTDAGDQSSGDSGKSYEVTKAGTTNSDDTPWGTYAVVGILSVLALAGVGFFFKGN